jgi:hypothetical protein
MRRWITIASMLSCRSAVRALLIWWVRRVPAIVVIAALGRILLLMVWRAVGTRLLRVAIVRSSVGTLLLRGGVGAVSRWWVGRCAAVALIVLAVRTLLLLVLVVALRGRGSAVGSLIVAAGAVVVVACHVCG